MTRTKPTSVTGHIDAAPKEARRHLRDIRALLKKVAPKATETLKWGAPILEEGDTVSRWSLSAWFRQNSTYCGLTTGLS